MKKSVCMLVTNPVTNDARVLKEAKVLGAAGYILNILAFRREGLPDVEEGPGYTIHRVAEANPPGVRGRLASIPEKIKWSRRRRRDFISAIERLGPEVIHAHDLDTLAAGALGATRSKARLVYDAHELYPDMAAAGTSLIPGLVRRYWAGIERRLAPRADLVIAVNKARARLMATRNRIDEPLVIRNCPELVETLSTAGRLRASAKAGPDDRIVLYQGGLTPGRALENIALSSHHLEKTVLVFLGGGSLRPALERLVEAEKLGHRVRFLDPVPPDELLALTADADVGVFAYEKTSLNNIYCAPNKLYEYMMAGVPFAGSALPPVEELAAEGAGATFASHDPSDIARAVSIVLEDQAQGGNMGKRGRQLAVERFNWEHESAKLLDAYEELGETALP